VFELQSQQFAKSDIFRKYNVFLFIFIVLLTVFSGTIQFIIEGCSNTDAFRSTVVSVHFLPAAHRARKFAKWLTPSTAVQRWAVHLHIHKLSFPSGRAYRIVASRRGLVCQRSAVCRCFLPPFGTSVCHR